jgi:RNA polymerase sigma-70 factor (ECF subfamily)
MVGRRVTSAKDLEIMGWVGSEILPHEADLRAWLRRSFDSEDVEDIIQEAYCRISALNEVSHIHSGRAYLFTTARSIVLTHIRRARIVRIDTVSEIEKLDVLTDEPSAERIVLGRRELARVTRLIEALPERCRRIFELRKIHGWSQRRIAESVGVPEYTVENDIARGMKLILKAIADGEHAAEQQLERLGEDGQGRDFRSGQ